MKTATKPAAPEKARGMTMAMTEKIYGITRRKQYSLIQDGVIKSYTLGRTRYIDVNSVESAISGSQA